MDVEERPLELLSLVVLWLNTAAGGVGLLTCGTRLSNVLLVLATCDLGSGLVVDMQCRSPRQLLGTS